MNKRAFFLTAAVAALMAAPAFAQPDSAPAETPAAPPMQHHAQGMLGALDANGDGALSKDEFLAPAMKQFDAMDESHDGKVTEEEMMAYQKKMVEDMRAHMAPPPGAPEKAPEMKAPEKAPETPAAPEGAPK